MDNGVCYHNIIFNLNEWSITLFVGKTGIRQAILSHLFFTLCLDILPRCLKNMARSPHLVIIRNATSYTLLILHM